VSIDDSFEGVSEIVHSRECSSTHESEVGEQLAGCSTGRGQPSIPIEDFALTGSERTLVHMNATFVSMKALPSNILNLDIALTLIPRQTRNKCSSI